jgi:hypothetical protein
MRVLAHYSAIGGSRGAVLCGRGWTHQVARLTTAPIPLLAGSQQEYRRIEVRHEVRAPHLLLRVRASIVKAHYSAMRILRSSLLMLEV